MKHKVGGLKTLICFCLLSTFYYLLSTVVYADELKLHDLIDEAVKNNHDLITSELRIKTSKYKIPQAGSLPDPMFMFGYQNEGYNRYTYGEMQGAQWMFSASQMFPFPGKLTIKEEMSEREHEGFKATHDYAILAVISRVKEVYYDLFLTYKSLDSVKDKAELFSKIENAAISRYSTGKASQQEVIMAQTEKYMLIEKEEMLKQKLQALEAMLNTIVGRDANSPLPRPEEPAYTSFNYNIEELTTRTYENSPIIKVKEKIIAGAKVKVMMADKEYYPDFTLAASLYKRRSEFQDMWSLTTTINIPLYFRSKQKMAVLEAESALSEAQHELEATKFMLSSSIRENYSMLKTAERLMELYKTVLTPKTYQDFEASLSGYITGRVEATTVINRLKSLIDYELSYWNQFVEREKVVARLEALTAAGSQTSAASEGKK